MKATRHASENSRPASKIRLGRLSGQRPRRSGRNVTGRQPTKQVENIHTHSLTLEWLANLSRTYGNILWIRYVCIFERRFGKFGILLILLYFFYRILNLCFFSFPFFEEFSWI